MFDYLLGIWFGFGVQVNYMYIDVQGVLNIGFKNDEFNGCGSVLNFDVFQFGLLFMLEYMFNMVGFMEIDSWSVCFVYNWCFDYMLMVCDVIYLFILIVYEFIGQLDGLFFYNLMDSIMVGVQGVNLLDEVFEISLVINE